MNLEHVSCDLCGSEDYRVRYRKPDDWLWSNLYEFPVVECVECGLVYVNPRPPFQEMAKFYPAGYHDGRDDSAHRLRYQAQFNYVANLARQTILDIGCARGDWLSYLHEQWPEAERHGVDAFSDGVNDTGIRFQKAQLPAADLPANYFDLITAWAVLEHVHTPDAYFAAVARILRSGGHFVILVTNSESFYGRYAYKEDVPRHLYHFSERSLAEYADKYGLVLDSVRYDESFWDGTGKGTFRHAMARWSRVEWRDIRLGRVSWLQRSLLRFGSLLDNVFFCGHWEALTRRSGIIVATFYKPQS